MEPEYVIVELKYCEGCGGLYLRAPGQALPYCAYCREKFSKIAHRPAPAEGREA